MLKEKLEGLISEFSQMEENNKKLNEDILAIEKEKKEGYKKFNTETHVLVEIELLDDIIGEIDNLRSYADSIDNYAGNTRTEIEDAGYYIDDVENYAGDLKSDAKSLMSKVEGLLEDEEEAEEENTDGAIKVKVQQNKY